MSVFRVWTKLNNVASNFVNIRAEIEDASVTVTLVIQTPFQMEQSSSYKTFGDEKHLKKLCQYDEQWKSKFHIYQVLFIIIYTLE